MFIGPCIIVIVEEWKTNLMSLAILLKLACYNVLSFKSIDTNITNDTICNISLALE